MNRAALLIACADLPVGKVATFSGADLLAALPAAERPAEWTAAMELCGLLSSDEGLSVVVDQSSGAVSILRFAAALDLGAMRTPCPPLSGLDPFLAPPGTPDHKSKTSK